MESSFSEIIQKDFRERMKRILLFEPIQELSQKRKSDQNGHPVDMRSLGLFTLLYFYEMKLIRERKTGIAEIIELLQSITVQSYVLNDKQWEVIVREIINVFRPANGKIKAYTFFNWESRKEDSLEFSYIKATDFDVQTNRQYYTLDDDGLELVFATKEYFQEFQLSIHQLMLRKLLEKGEFQGALRQINEMQIDVETIYERLVKLEHEVKRNIVSIETQNRFIQAIDDRNFRLNRENEEFQELKQFVNEMKANYYYQPTQNKEKEAFELLTQIEKELSLVHGQHRALLNQSLILKREVLQAAEESLYYVGIDTFNFDQDITSRIVSTPLPLESMKGILMPFLSLKKKKSWSLLSIFAPHSWSEEEQTTNKNIFAKVADEQQKEKYAKMVRAFYAEIMREMLQMLEGKTDWTLSQFIEKLKELKHPFLDQRLFYSFFILCHQRSPLYAENDWDDEESLHLLDGALEELHGRKLIVKELPDVLSGSDRYEIQNMYLHME